MDVSIFICLFVYLFIFWSGTYILKVCSFCDRSVLRACVATTEFALTCRGPLVLFVALPEPDTFTPQNTFLDGSGSSFERRIVAHCVLHYTGTIHHSCTSFERILQYFDACGKLVAAASRSNPWSYTG